MNTFTAEILCRGLKSQSTVKIKEKGSKNCQVTTDQSVPFFSERARATALKYWWFEKPGESSSSLYLEECNQLFLFSTEKSKPIRESGMSLAEIAKAWLRIWGLNSSFICSWRIQKCLTSVLRKKIKGTSA